MFEHIKNQVRARFTILQAQDDLFEVDLPKGALNDAYLAALPEELRQEHTCNCCRSFLNNYGNVVALKDGRVLTLWDFEVEYPYNNVPAALHKLVSEAAICDYFVTTEKHLGTDFNVQLKDGKTIRWTHFYAQLLEEKRLRSAVSVDTVKGDFRTNQQVFERSLRELTIESTETVLDLIAQNSLYRGEEHKAVLEAFLKHQKTVVLSLPSEISNYAWEHAKKAPRIRNTVIGSLLVDLSEGRPLDAAVASYEQKVAPANYRRPTALVTPAMLKKAEAELAELNMTESLIRRHATVDDIPVTEVLFVNRQTKAPETTASSIFQSPLVLAAVDMKSLSKVEEVSAERFFAEVVPTATHIDVLFESKHAGNLVNLTAPADPEAPTLFSWPNGIAWTYKDGGADYVRERVKNAGGSVDGFLRISLAWSNYDDLDLHVFEPSGREIYFSDKVSRGTGGNLDVDMNAGGGKTREPVENVVYPTAAKMAPGKYHVRVHNYAKRESVDVGFTLEMEWDGHVLQYSYPKPLADKRAVEAATIHVDNDKSVAVEWHEGMVQGVSAEQELYGLMTKNWYPVTLIAPSPNYWGDSATGNRHTFFILPDARTEDDTRGFFNEFLTPGLRDHRKVFELLGSKVKVAPEGPQLAGLGFSSTQRAEVYCRVTDSFTRVIKVKF
jgi:hypothetical protein